MPDLGEGKKNREYAINIIKEGSIYTAIKFDGTIVSSSATLETVLQAALNLKGDVIIGGIGAVWTSATEFQLSAGFVGPIDILSDTNFTIAKNCTITCAQGFTGTMFRLKNTSNSTIDFYGYLDERGTPSQLWTALLLESAAGEATGYNVFNGKGGMVYDSGTTLELKATSTGWVNANTFNNFETDGFIIGIKFNSISSGVISGNNFSNCVLQCHAATTNAIKNVVGSTNTFVSCYVWDVPGGAKGMDILSTAANTTIIGGYPALDPGDDLSSTTIHLYPGHTLDDFMLSTNIPRINSAFTYWGGSHVFPNQAVYIYNPAQTFSYYLATSAIAASRGITLPLLTGDDIFVFEAHTQTLTNKTISGASNTISAIPDTALSANVPLKNTANSFTDTLTMANNKQMLGKLTGGTSVNIARISTGDALQIGDFDAIASGIQLFAGNGSSALAVNASNLAYIGPTWADSVLKFRNPADTFSYTVATSAIGANRTLTLPAVANDCTFAFLNGGNQEWGNQNGYLSTGIYMWNPAITFVYTLRSSAITGGRDITLPLLPGNDTFVCEAMAQPLTNKTINARSNTELNIAQNPLVKRWGAFQAAGGTTATTIGSVTGVLGSHVGTGAGTNTVTYDTTEGVIANFVATATGNLNIGLVSPTGGPIARRLFGCKMTARVKIDSTTSARMYVGFAGAALAISDTPIASGVAGVMVGFTSAATNFEIYSNDETGAMTTTAITGPIAKNANWHTIEINWAASGNVDVIFDGTTQTLSSQIPLTTSNLFFNCVGQTTTTTARTFSIHDVWLEIDK